MIIEMLLTSYYNVMNTLMVINIPDLPDSVYGYIEDGFQYIVAGAGILANYTPLAYLMTLFGVLLAVDAGILVYHFIMWVIRKIPMAGMS